MAQTLHKEMAYRDSMVRRASLFPYKTETNIFVGLSEEEHGERNENSGFFSSSMRHEKLDIDFQHYFTTFPVL